MWDTIFPYLAAVLPTIGLLVIGVVVFRSLVEADRRERKAQAEWEAGRAARERDGGRSGDPGSG